MSDYTNLVGGKLKLKGLGSVYVVPLSVNYPLNS